MAVPTTKDRPVVRRVAIEYLNNLGKVWGLIAHYRPLHPYPVTNIGRVTRPFCQQPGATHAFFYLYALSLFVNKKIRPLLANK